MTTGRLTRVGRLVGLGLGLLLGLGVPVGGPGPGSGLARAQGAGVEFRWTAPASLPSLDPYSLPGLEDQGVLANVYEGLIKRRPDLTLEPGLAADWSPVTDTRWRFYLREKVQFHDGSPLTADDVVAALERAREAGSALATLLAPVRRVRRIDDKTVDVYTDGPVADLPERLVLVPIVDDAWLGKAGSRLAGQANGTGPFRVTGFSPGGVLTLESFAGWWDRARVPQAIARAVLYPAPRAEDRLQFLLENRVDLALDLLPQMVTTLERSPGVAPQVGIGARTLMLGLDQASRDLRNGRAQGNPFRDRRVREAMMRALDVPALLDQVMDGQGTPAALIAAPVLPGVPEGINLRPVPDLRRARALLAEAGLPEVGFAVTLDCPTGHYLRDAALCRGVADQLSEAGIRTTVQSLEPQAYFNRILTRQSSLFLLGWLPNTLEVTNPILNLAACPREVTPGQAPPPGPGALNLGGYCDAEVGRLAARLAATLHPPHRHALAAEVLLRLRDDVAYVPLFQPPVIWGRRATLQVLQRADGVLDLRFVRLIGRGT